MEAISGMDPNRRRLDDLLSRRHLWEEEIAELNHLASLCGVKVRLQRLDLKTGAAMQEEVNT